MQSMWKLTVVWLKIRKFALRANFNSFVNRNYLFNLDTSRRRRRISKEDSTILKTSQFSFTRAIQLKIFATNKVEF